MLRSGVVVSALIEKSALRGSGRFGDVEHLAQETGGPVLTAVEVDATQRFGALLDSLRARHTLGYRPSVARPVGSLCRLKVTLSPDFWAAHPEVKAKDVQLRARSSYVR